jgi:hypothetical protein
MVINVLKKIIMGCGCKNKAQQTQTTQQSSQSQTLQQVQAQAPKTQPIQESIRKVVERYYTKK